MKRISVLGVGVVAALLLAVAAAGSASAAAPEYGRCLKKAKVEGNGYANSKCTTVGEGKKAKYEWVAGAERAKFTSTGGIGVLTTVGGASVECKAESSDGEFVPGNNKEEAGVYVTFTGCKAEGLPCTSPHHATGELETEELEGIVGWENKARKKTDLELYPAKSVKSKFFIEFECSGLVIKVRGNILVPVKNDTMTDTTTLKFNDSKGKQKPEKWEESAEKAILESSFSNIGGGAWEQAGQKITSTVKGEEKLELNAVI
ncbi:MAG TPA: hypothetical protein VMB51_13900 [Solirubrobacteraceae bacterium]|nr:hypothetical protein [Solirubrobacteraceae bacterium]